MSDHDSIAASAASGWGLPAPVLVRRGMASLYHAGPDTVIKIFPSAPSAFSAPSLPTLLARMSRLDVHAPSLRRDILEVGVGVGVGVGGGGGGGGGRVTVMAMERLHAVGELDWEAVGAMVRRLHTIDPAEVGVDARCGDFPHWQVEELLASARPGLDPASLAGIERCMGQWQGWRDRMDSAPAVLCHGDLHPGNVMQTERGPALLDWDMRCRGPVAWDHGPLLQWEDRWTTRWGGGPGTYDAFAAGYGANLRDDWLARALAAMRMVIATLMRVRAALTDPSAVPEAQRRLAYWRGDADAPLWEPQ